MINERKERIAAPKQTPKSIIDTRKKNIIQSLKECTDYELLDFIYKLVVNETQRSKNNAL